MNFKKILSCILVSLPMVFVACDDYLEPSPDNFYDNDRILRDAAFAEGLLLQTYTAMPQAYSFNEVATDDAVMNDESHPFARMATGEWTAQFDPISSWSTAYEQIYYLNHFLSLNDEIEWSWESEERDALFRKRFEGEARALRAWFNFELLRNHGGVSEDGQLLGFVILTPEILNASQEALRALPRSSYADCLTFILDDLNEAIDLLPDVYANEGNVNYNEVFGDQNRNRINGMAARALKSRVLLHAASQSFNNATSSWEAAADAAGELLSEAGGVGALSATGGVWYRNDADPEIIWRRDYVQINSWEAQNFPPSLFGMGRVNPSQNFVDAFPMASGYPIADPASGYDEDDPYAGRDPRLTRYVVYNGGNIGGRSVQTHTGSSTDGLNQSINATRTGYYLKKLLREDVNLDPSTTTTQRHFYTFFRFTEVFLNYAEAANEAWGPDVDGGGFGFTARDVVAALRQRAGIAQPDNYLASLSDKSALRNLIRNERRIELSFEGFRFWDLRRWDESLNTTVRGVSITGGVHDIVDVENRVFQSYMKFGPVPYAEVLRNSNLQQNEGWK